MSKLVKKIVLGLLSFLLLFSSYSSYLTPLVHAQESTWYNQNFNEWYVKVYGEESPPNEIFGERYTAAQVQWILYGLFAFPINFLGSKVQSAVSCVIAFGPGSVVDKAECIQKSVEIALEALDVLKISISDASSTEINPGFFKSVAAGMNNRRLSGAKYFQNTLFRNGIVSKVNAQGFGYNEIDGLQQYWQGFRNIAYALSVLVIVIFAFMIMFRVKISPQVIISVQSALPKVFIALILATFSYAIAGFVIDFSYVVGGLLSSLMHLAGFSSSFSDAWKFIVPIDLTSVLGGFYIFGFMFVYTIIFFLAAIWSLVGTVSGLSVFGALVSALMILMTLWVLILMLWYTIKVPWVLIKNLISFFLSVVIAPVQITIGALVPSIGFGAWFKKITAEALVFPVTGLFLFLAMKTLIASFAASTGQSLFAELGIIDLPNQNLWTPPILGSSEDMAGILWLGMSFIFITMIPKAIDIMKMLIMGEKFAFGSAIGEAMAPAQQIWGATGAPVTRSFQEAAGRNRVVAIQKKVRKGVTNANIPDWLKQTLLANPGKE